MQDLEKGEWLNNDSASNHSFYLFFKKKIKNKLQLICKDLAIDQWPDNDSTKDHIFSPFFK